MVGTHHHHHYQQLSMSDSQELVHELSNSFILWVGQFLDIWFSSFCRIV